MEKWKALSGFEGIYEVSNLGRVKSLERYVDYGNRICHRKERILSIHYDTDGYSVVKLKDNKNHRVHRLVAETWIPNPKNLPEVDHIDRNRRNAKVENLRWVTRSENIKHTYDFIPSKDISLGKNRNAKPCKLINADDGKIYKFDCVTSAGIWLNELQQLNLTIERLRSVFLQHKKNKEPFKGFYIIY